MITKPFRDIVLIKADAPPEQTKTGIFLTEDWKTLPPIGTVMAIGPDVKDKSLLGKRVVFERYSSIVLPKIDGVDYRFCKEVSLLAEVEDES